MHRVQGAHSKGSQTETAHVVGHGGHPTARLEGVHVGVRTEGLGEWRRVSHDCFDVNPEKEKKIF